MTVNRRILIVRRDPVATRFSEVLSPVGPPSLDAPVDRWSAHILRVASADRDLPTLDAWAAFAGLSRPTLRNRCRAVGASAKDSLSFARLVRTVLQGDAGCWRPEDLLAVVDVRTMAGLLRKGGLTSYLHVSRPPLWVLFERHAFRIPRACVEAVHRQLLGEATRHRDQPCGSAPHGDSCRGFCR